MTATSACIAASSRSMRWTSALEGPWAAVASWAAAKIDQKSSMAAAKVAEAWIPKPTRTRRNALPSWRKMSRGLNIVRNIPRSPALLVLVSTISSPTGRPKQGAAAREHAAEKTKSKAFPPPRYVREIAPSATCDRRLLNISCHGKGGVVIPGQTGFVARRIVERRLQDAPEVGGDQSFPRRNRLDSVRFTGPSEPSRARSDVPDLVAIDPAEDGGRSRIAGRLEPRHRRRSDVEAARLQHHRHDRQA